MEPQPVPGGQLDAAFRFQYPLAFIGCFLTFHPLLTVILPLKAAEIAPGDKVTLLSQAMFVGAVIASIGNVAIGALSDRTFRRHGTRRRWIVAGLPVLACGYAVLALASSAAALFGALLLLQLSFNMILSPLNAILADHVEDRWKGRVAGLLNLAPPVGMGASALIALPWFGSLGNRLLILFVASIALMLPLLLSRRYRASAPALSAPPPPAAAAARLPVTHDFAFLFASRLLVQIGFMLAIAYLLYFLEDRVSGAGALHDAQLRFALLTGLAAGAASLWSYLTGIWSDRGGRRKLFLLLSGLAMVPSLLLMAHIPGWPLLVLAYLALQAGHGSFIAIDMAASMQCLPSAETRGRYLGILNLTNTLPSMIVPGLGLAILARANDYPLLFLISAALIAIGVTLFLRIRILR